MQLERIAPECLTPECLEAECLLALVKQCLCVTRDVRIKACLGGRCGKGKHSADRTRAKRCDYCGPNFHVAPPFLGQRIGNNTISNLFQPRSQHKRRTSTT